MIFNSYLNGYFVGVPCTVLKTSNIRLDGRHQWVMDVHLHIYDIAKIDSGFPCSDGGDNTTCSLLGLTKLKPGTTVNCLSIPDTNQSIIVDPLVNPASIYYLSLITRLLIICLMFIFLVNLLS